MNIALICATSTPIPATKGGATETMMTHMLEVNEECAQNKFHILGYYDDEAASQAKHFQHSVFHYYQPKRRLEYIEGLFWRFLRKISAEKIYLRSQYVRWCADIINKSDFDVVVVEGNCFQVEHLRELIGSNKIILHMHIDRINNELKAANRIIQSCDGLFAISQFCKKRMLEVAPDSDDRVIVVKNTIDTEKFQYQGDEVKHEIRAKLNIRPDQKVISYCGRIDPNKGVLELVNAVKQLNDPTLHLLVIGSSIYFGSGKNDYINKIEQEAKLLSGGATFTGYIPQAELPTYISASDIAIVPSVCQEAAGNVTIEALSCGVPVIASSQGGIPEYADTSACRLVNYDMQFSENIAKNIHELAYDTNLYARLKSNARNVALQYDKHNYYTNFCNAVKQILAL